MPVSYRSTKRRRYLIPTLAKYKTIGAIPRLVGRTKLNAMYMYCRFIMYCTTVYAIIIVNLSINQIALKSVHEYDMF